jgi:hypothetical protein
MKPPVRRDLLAPERMERMAKEMHTAYAERMKEMAARVEALLQLFPFALGQRTLWSSSKC